MCKSIANFNAFCAIITDKHCNKRRCWPNSHLGYPVASTTLFHIDPLSCCRAKQGTKWMEIQRFSYVTTVIFLERVEKRFGNSPFSCIVGETKSFSFLVSFPLFPAKRETLPQLLKFIYSGNYINHTSDSASVNADVLKLFWNKILCRQILLIIHVLLIYKQKIFFCLIFIKKCLHIILIWTCPYKVLTN